MGKLQETLPTLQLDGSSAGADDKLLKQPRESAVGRKMTTRTKTFMKFLFAGIYSVIWVHLLATAALAQAMPAQINIVIVSGDGAQNDVQQRAGTEPVVRIEDERHNPIPNAIVAFTLPTEGATGEFGNHSRTLAVTTDSQGQAVAKGLRTNQVPGKVPIHINASYRGLTASASMTQYTVAREGVKSGHKGGKIVAILLILGGAAAGGAYAALRNRTSAPSASTPVPTAIGITAGTGTISAPAH